MNRRPLPEFTGKRYTVTQTKPQPGLPMTNLRDLTMAVPMGATPLERAIRAHEVAHAMVSRITDTKARKVRRLSYISAEEARVNTLAERSGVDMSPMVFAADVAAAEEAIASEDLREVARIYAMLSGGRRASWAKGRENVQDEGIVLDPKWWRQVDAVCAKLDAYCAVPDAELVDEEWPIKVGRWMDALANPDKPKPKPPPKQQQQQQQQQSDEAPSGPQSDDDEDWDSDDDESSEDEQDEDGKMWDDLLKDEDDDESEDDDEDDASQTNPDDESDDEQDDGADFNDGEDEDADDLEAGEDPHCVLEAEDFEELNDSILQRAMAEQVRDKNFGAPRRFPMPPPPRPGTWMPWDGVMDEPPRTEQAEGGELGRKNRLSRAGSLRRADQLFVKDGSPYLRKRKARGGTVLVDLSGSMAVTIEDIRTILEAAPGATIAGYCTWGIPFILVKDGMRMSEEAIHARSGGGNGYDGNALRWLAEQEGPRVWVSDNMVHGGQYGGSHEELLRECYETCLSARILRVDPNGIAGRRSVHYGHSARLRMDWYVPASFGSYAEVGEAMRRYWNRHES